MKMARLQHLPMRVLRSITRELVKDYRQKKDILDLLPLRLVCRSFEAAITPSVFHTCRIKADATLGIIPSRLDPWTRAGRLLSLKAQGNFFAMIQNLTFSIEGAQGYYSCTAKDKKRQLIDLLAIAGKHVRELTLGGQILAKEVDDVWLGTHRLPQFAKLEVANIGGFYMPLLPALLERSPQLRTLRLCKSQPHLHTGEMLKRSSCYKTPHKASQMIDCLEVEDANDERFLDFLKGSHLCPKRVTLVWPNFDPSSVTAVDLGVKTWIVFSQVKRVTIRADRKGHAAFSSLKAAFKLRNVVLKCTNLGSSR